MKVAVAKEAAGLVSGGEVIGVGTGSTADCFIDELGRMVVSQVQLVDGITRTLTCPVVHL